MYISSEEDHGIKMREAKNIQEEDENQLVGLLVQTVRGARKQRKKRNVTRDLLHPMKQKVIEYVLLIFIILTPSSLNVFV